MSIISSTPTPYAQNELPLSPDSALKMGGALLELWNRFWGGRQASDVQGPYRTEEEAAIAGARVFYRGTRQSGLEMGALILKKGDQYFLGRHSRGAEQRINQQTIQAEVSVSDEEVRKYQQQGYQIVSHLHSHPDSRAPYRVEEGPAMNDLHFWSQLGVKQGYLVTGDGDVLQTRIPSAKEAQKSGQDPLKLVQLKRIADVDPGYSNWQPLNVWGYQPGPPPRMVPLLERSQIDQGS
jgi:hypothetical protein